MFGDKDEDALALIKKRRLKREAKYARGKA